METVKLNNGVRMPVIGFGAYQIEPVLAQRCVRDALELGCRLIDTAQSDENQEEVGAAVRFSGLPRQEIFLSARVRDCADADSAFAAVEKMLREMRLEKLDLVLLEGTENAPAVYRGLEAALRAGLTRAVGLSNFEEEAYLRILRECFVVPAVDRVEAHVFRQQQDLSELLKKHGTRMVASAPLAGGRNGIFGNPTLTGIGSRRGKSPAQVALRWLYQRGIIPVPRTVRAGRMKENLDIFDFELNPTEMREIRALDMGTGQIGLL